MAKWRKKPIAVEAYQWFKESNNFTDVTLLEKEHVVGDMIFVGKIRTLEDTEESCHYVMEGDYIVHGNCNDVWAIKEAIFLKNYEKIKEKKCKEKLS
jgi:hypothetical protein